MDDKTGINSVFHENGHFRIGDKRVSNDEIAEIVSKLAIPQGADELMVLNQNPFCRYDVRAEDYIEPTPIQKRIEYAVTNGRGYLEKDQIRFAIIPYFLAEVGVELPIALELTVARLNASRNGETKNMFTKNDLPRRRNWLGEEFYSPDGRIEPARGVRR